MTGTIESISGADEVGAGGALIRQVKFRVSNPGGLTGTTAATAVVGSVACAGSGTFSQSTGQTVVAQTAGEITALHVTSGSPVSYGTVLATVADKDKEEALPLIRRYCRGDHPGERPHRRGERQAGPGQPAPGPGEL